MLFMYERWSVRFRPVAMSNSNTRAAVIEYISPAVVYTNLLNFYALCRCVGIPSQYRERTCSRVHVL